MDNKILLQELALGLSSRSGISKKDSDTFVRSFFEVIEQALVEDKIVKVKGLGTFKVVEVSGRESVDVNTGNRIHIKGHSKITFTPDPLIRDQVNRPFAEFDTVILNDGVDIEAMEAISNPLANEESVADELPVVEKVAGTLDDSSVDEPIVEEPVIEKSVKDEPIVEAPIVEEPVIEKPDTEEPVVEEAVVEEPVVENQDIEETTTVSPAVDLAIEEPVDESLKTVRPVLGERVGVIKSTRNDSLETEPDEAEQDLEDLYRTLRPAWAVADAKMPANIESAVADSLSNEPAKESLEDPSDVSDSEEAAPVESTPMENAPEEVLPEESTSKEVAPEEIAPVKPTPEEIKPEDASSEQSDEIPSKEADTMETTLEESSVEIVEDEVDSAQQPVESECVEPAESESVDDDYAQEDSSEVSDPNPTSDSDPEPESQKEDLKAKYKRPSYSFRGSTEPEVSERKWLTTLLYVLGLIACLVIGYVLGCNHVFCKEAPVKEPPSPVVVPQQPLIENDTEDDIVEGEPDPDAADPDEIVEAKPTYPQVNGGEYEIVGVKAIHAIKKGESINILARQYFGDMEMNVYIIKLNNLKRPDLVEVGQQIKIPELKRK